MILKFGVEFKLNLFKLFTGTLRRLSDRPKQQIGDPVRMNTATRKTRLRIQLDQSEEAACFSFKLSFSCFSMTTGLVLLTRTFKLEWTRACRCNSIS